MKKFSLVALVATVATSTILSAGPLVPNKTLDIVLDGYSCGVHLIINEKTGLVGGNGTGCWEGSLVHGYVGASSKLGAGVVVGMTSSDGTSPFIMILDDKPRTWSLERVDTELNNHGTWQVGVASDAESESPLANEN